MLLTRLLRRLRRDEEGVALAAVVGLMATSLLLTTVVAAAVISTTKYTTTVRADVQSQAAAEAGVAAARAGLVGNTCTANGHIYSSLAGATPRYVATIWKPSGTSWVRGCPTLGTQARILSTGYASSPGVGGASADNQTSIEVILGSVTVPTTISATGAAIYSYSANQFGGSGVLTGVNGSQPTVLVKTGDLNCDGAGSGTMSLVVDAGKLDIGGSCNIAGSAWASGRITHSGGAYVGGNLIGNGVTMDGSAAIQGSIFSTSDVLLGGAPTVRGNITAASLNVQSSATIGGSAWIYGATTLNWTASIAGNLTTKTLSTPSASFVKGTTTVKNPNTPGTSPYATPTRPTVPGWVDFGYDKSKWVGFTEIVLTSSDCSYTTVQQKLTNAGTASVLLDARNCATFALSGWEALTINGDLAIISNDFSLDGSGSITASGGTTEVWLINPDATANGIPTCASGQKFSIGGTFGFSSNISVMMYSPCQIQIASSTYLRGQIFAGQARVGGAAQIGYVQVGLPGVNLDTGGSSASSGTEAQRVIISSRNVQVGN